MNRRWTIWLTACLLFSALTGCGDSSQTTTEESVIESAPTPTSAPEQIWREPTESLTREPLRALDGTWGYRDPKTGEIDILRFEDDTFSIQTADQEIGGTVTRDRFYAGEDQEPDLLLLTTSDQFDYSSVSDMGVEPSSSGDSLGDYLTAVAVCDGEALLSLRQANNGEGILSYVLPGNGYSYLLHRKGVEGVPAQPRRNDHFPGFVWRCDREHGRLWVSAAAECDRDESDQPVYTLTGDGQAAEYSASDELLDKAFQDCVDPSYPQEVYQITVDGDGKVTKIKS